MSFPYPTKEPLISVAPMMGFTNRHCRYFHRILSKNILLYTEMVTANALLLGDKKKFLKFSTQEKPVAFQLGGSHPNDLAKCARIIEDVGYSEVNLNVGCPSDRVQNAKIGACLMLEPELVAQCVYAMKQKVNIPVTVKHRIGINNKDSYEDLINFIKTIHDAGCDYFIVHARTAILDGLSPKQNREIPPLKPQMVYQLKKDLPYITIIYNGGVLDINHINEHLQHLDGVMIGRQAYHRPYILAEIEKKIFKTSFVLDRKQVMNKFINYIENEIDQGEKMNRLIKPVLGLFHNQIGNKKFKQYLSQYSHLQKNDLSVLINKFN